MAKKVCSKCKIFVEKEACPICGGSNFLTTWKGRIFILNPEKSDIARKIGAVREVEYAIKIR